MHGFLRRSLLAFCLMGGPPAAYAFDCAKAYLPVDFVICRSPAVFRANEAHEKTWYETRARLNDAEKQELLADQRRWLAERAVFLEQYQSRAAQAPIHQTAQPNKPQYSRIDQVDFLNFTYPTGSADCSNPPPDARKTVTLKGGRFHRKFREGELQYAIAKNNVAFGDITGSPTGEAVIALQCNFMANFWTTTIYVYTLRDEIPTLLAKFPDPSDWGVITISAHNGSVVIEGLMDEPHACPKSIGRFTYTWNGSSFILAGKPVKTRNKGC